MYNVYLILCSSFCGCDSTYRILFFLCFVYVFLNIILNYFLNFSFDDDSSISSGEISDLNADDTLNASNISNSSYGSTRYTGSLGRSLNGQSGAINSRSLPTKTSILTAGKQGGMYMSKSQS